MRNPQSSRRGRPAGDARELETVKLVNELLLERPVSMAGRAVEAFKVCPLADFSPPPLRQLDVLRLRRVVAIRGLVNDGVSCSDARQSCRRCCRRRRRRCCPAAWRRLLPSVGAARFHHLHDHPRPLALLLHARRDTPPTDDIPPLPPQLRSRVWPLLLGVGEAAAPDEAARFAALAGSTHKDSHVVECDMARSLWSYTEGAARVGRGAGQRLNAGGRAVPRAAPVLICSLQSRRLDANRSIDQRIPARPAPVLPGAALMIPCKESRGGAQQRSTRRRLASFKPRLLRPNCRLTAGWSEEGRAAKRAALRRVIDAAVGSNTSGIFYYQGAGWCRGGAHERRPTHVASTAVPQLPCAAAAAGLATSPHSNIPPPPPLPGLHDIAAVLLFVCGSELAAWRLLHALAGGHLRDCTRVDLAAATETLRLLYPILERARGGDPCIPACLHPACLHVGLP